MALSPKDLLKSNAVDEAMLSAIEMQLDAKLRDYEDGMVPGKEVSLSFAETGSGMTAATAKALKRLYTKAGWNDVQVNTTHSIITMTCPRTRTTRGRVPREESHAVDRRDAE